MAGSAAHEGQDKRLSMKSLISVVCLVLVAATTVVSSSQALAQIDTISRYSLVVGGTLAHASPFDDMKILALESPVFKSFHKSLYTAKLTVAVAQGREMLFLDGCAASQNQGRWVISGCRSVRVDETDFLAKLVKLGGATQTEPENAALYNRLMSDARKARKASEIAELVDFGQPKSKDGKHKNSDVDQDIKACGEKRYFDALATLPDVESMGPGLVVVDLSYSLFSSKPVTVHFTSARTKDGWRFGSIRVTCQ